MYWTVGILLKLLNNPNPYAGHWSYYSNYSITQTHMQDSCPITQLFKPICWTFVILLKLLNNSNPYAGQLLCYSVIQTHMWELLVEMDFGKHCRP